jgi:peptidoglycan-N-acetylglucosamine deacetylase
MSKKLQTTILVLLLLSAHSALARTNPTSATTPTQKKDYYVNKNFDLVPFDPKANKKVVLITIDDGPSTYSKSMVATLLAHKAPAIFFVNGIHEKNNAGSIAMEHKAGFTIGNHTWDHANLSKIKDSKTLDEISRNTKLITEITGSAPRFFRAPYGVSTPYSRNLVKNNGMISMNWSGAAKDWEKNTRDEKVFLGNVMSNLHDGEILLIHEHEWTDKYLSDLLVAIQKKGYTFVSPEDIGSNT